MIDKVSTEFITVECENSENLEVSFVGAELVEVDDIFGTHLPPSIENLWLNL